MDQNEAASAAPVGSPDLVVALLTGGGDRPYVLGLVGALTAVGIRLEVIGSDFLDCRELRENPRVRFLNLRGDMSPDVPVSQKISRVVSYYLRLLRYVVTAKPRIFHVLWNGRLEYLERTVLPTLLKALGKRVVRTVHNVNAGERDGTDGALNRWSLRIQYRMSDHLFVHTEKMLQKLRSEYAVETKRISVIPFGINSTVPDTELTGLEARRRLGLDPSAKVVLFFGNIAPYKGLEHLVSAFATVLQALQDCRLVIAGRPKGSEQYWASIERDLEHRGIGGHVIRRIEYVPDEETEVYFKAADVLALPYLYVFQSGVLFLGYNFGLPVIASDVASLRDDVVEGRTGYICPPADPRALAESITRYFGSELFEKLAARKSEIREFSREKYSWERVSEITVGTYLALVSK